jgi:hypothetical protein
MATVRVTAWRDIPVLVTARDGAGEVSVPLPPAFQDLVDRVALREGCTEPEAYLAAWQVCEAGEREGAAAAVAAAVAAELAGTLGALRARHGLGAPDAG